LNTSRKILRSEAALLLDALLDDEPLEEELLELEDLEDEPLEEELEVEGPSGSSNAKTTSLNQPMNSGFRRKACRHILATSSGGLLCNS
jgi:hypothetical protein